MNAVDALEVYEYGCRDMVGKVRRRWCSHVGDWGNTTLVQVQPNYAHTIAGPQERRTIEEQGQHTIDPINRV